MTTFDQRIQGRDNNFDFLRFALAAAVLFSHSFVQTYGTLTTDPLMRLTGNRAYIGELAVNGFFIISGFLIAMSWIRSKGTIDFLKKRVARIFPGYLVVAFLCAFLVAPLGGLPWGDIVQPSYVIKNVARILTFSFFAVPGSFETLYDPGNLNGSLWTIRYEFQCYLMVMIIGLVIGYRRRSAVLALAGMALTLFVLQFVFAFAFRGALPLIGDANQWPAAAQRAAKFLVAGRDIPGIGNPMHWPRFVGCFALGMILTVYKDVIPYSGKLALAAVVIPTAVVIASLQLFPADSAFGPIVFSAVMPVCLTYLVFYVAFNTAVPFQHFGKFGDFSYGLYLYAWPIQVLLLYHFGKHFNPYTHSLTAFLLTMPLAIVSWHFIEKPFLKKAHSKRPAVKEGDASQVTVAPLSKAPTPITAAVS